MNGLPTTTDKHPLVALIMGSQSDWETMRHAAETLDALGIDYEARIISAHRTPDRLYRFAASAKAAGFHIVIAGAGGAAHLPGMTAALTPLPVFGVPVESKALSGVDSLHSIVQMPAGVPVGTLAIGTSGAINAALLAAAVLALHDEALAARLAEWRAEQTAAVTERPLIESSAKTGTRRVSILVPPGGVLGILGGGQLGRMLALAAARLGIECHVYCPDPDSPAFQVVRRRTCAAYDDETALGLFAGVVDAITYEFENIPALTAHRLSKTKPLAPSIAALGTTADRLTEKTFIRELGIGAAELRPVNTLADLTSAIAEIGCPAVLKTRRFGYDGKGQTIIRSDSNLEDMLAIMNGQPAILEAFVSFTKEISVIAARGYNGEVAVYDLVENEHRGHILFRSMVPADVPEPIEERAKSIAARIASELDYVGVLAVELFVTGEGEVLVNEIAPRVHNSGHWTLEACVISQFENHVRAVCGWPLGAPARHSNAVMQNLIGDEIADWATLAAIPQAAVHLYGKHQAKPGRKMGHVTQLYPIVDR